VRQPSCGAGCLALAEGIPITDVSRRLGHNNIEVTTRSTDTSYCSFDRARTALDAVYHKNRSQQ
jgi:hypothetical protein